PDAPQRVLEMPEGIFAVQRVSVDETQTVYALHNITGNLKTLDIDHLGKPGARWYDALHQMVPDIDEQGLRLRPYQTVWLMAKG
ncbi:MAG: hypothetical protein ABW101_12190, partial [Candidatus Thiodiazotropha sp.]